MQEGGGQPHILVVDDARDIREPLVRYLKESGYRASAAENAAAARRAMRTSGIDLVILDIMMPGEDGLSLCRSIRESSGIPVIMLTARGEELDRIVGPEVGADDCLEAVQCASFWRASARLRRTNTLRRGCGPHGRALSLRRVDVQRGAARSRRTKRGHAAVERRVQATDGLLNGRRSRFRASSS